MTDAPKVSGPRRLLRRLRDVMAGHGRAQDRLDQLVRIIASDMVAEVCSCYLMRAGEVLELFATQGLNASAVHKTRLQISEGLVGHIAANARPLNLADAQSRDGRVIGVLVVQNRTRRNYDEEEVEALQVVAMVIAELAAGGELVDLAELLAPEGRFTGPAVIEGQSLVPGLGLGTAVVRRPQAPVTRLIADDPASEKQRLVEAVSALREGLDQMLAAPDLAPGGEPRDVLETFRMFADDSGWLRRIEEAIDSGLTAEAAVIRVQEDTRVRMSQSASSYLRERLLDLEELANRLSRHLTGEAGSIGGSELPDDVVLVARSLGPAELLEIDRERLRGVVLEEGSPTMHLAIVARALEIPVVGQVRDALSRLSSGETVIVDGTEGRITARPDEGEIQLLHEQAADRSQRLERYRSLRDEKAVTRDGVEISLNINVGLLVDAMRMGEIGADGVGLCRTEIPFMMSSRYPDINAQTQLYRGIMESAGDRPVVFRTLDIGGDKRLPYLPAMNEENPAMGWRAIRIGLDRPAILRHQLRALLRAAEGRALSVMFPMIATVSEFEDAKALLDRELRRGRELGEPLPDSLKVGAMIEVPALMWQLPALLESVDFVSVGTNDLVQFLFASDRGNSVVSKRYGILSPAVLALFRQLVVACDSHGVPLTVCGEAAGEPVEAMALAGVGVRSLSMPPGRLGAVKVMCRSLSLAPLARYLEGLHDSADMDLNQRMLDFAHDHGVEL
jgi:phosphotransferase system enzyme I (PtsP)